MTAGETKRALDEAKRFMEQFERNRVEMANLKATVPEMFPEWQELMSAEAGFVQAKKRLALARQRWSARAAAPLKDKP